ncbi:MAG: PQQ-binding-like beta-propeller repeat protein, partial [Thermoplasmata archaeon]
MIRSDSLRITKIVACVVVVAMLGSSFIVLLVSDSSRDGFDSQSGDFPGNNIGRDVDESSGEMGPPSPADVPVYPWPMHLHDELHRSFTQSPAPSTSDVLWYNFTGSWTYGSPAIAEGKVFIGARNTTGDYMFAFYQKNGTLAWKTQTLLRVSGNYGVTSSPAYSNGVVFFGGDRIYALYASNGAIKWTVNTGNSNWGDGTATVADGKVFIGGSDRKMYAIEQDTGNVLWTFQTQSSGGANYGLYAAPAVWNGHAYVAACDGWVYQIMIDQPGPIAVANHSFFTGYAMYGSPVIFDGKVYIGNGYTFKSTINRFYALDAIDLSVVWEFYPGASTSFLSSAAIAYDKLYVGSVDGNLYVLDPYGFGGLTAVIWQYYIGNTWSSPAIASGQVFIGSKSNYLYAFDANQSGSPNYRWRYNM